MIQIEELDPEKLSRKEELKSQIAWMEEDLAQLKEELNNLEE